MLWKLAVHSQGMQLPEEQAEAKKIAHDHLA